MTDTAETPTDSGEHFRASFTSFEESTAEEWAKIIPQLEVTQSMVADRVLGLLRDLETDHGGFPVNRLEHSLQTATRAEKAGKDDEYVFCALIHDVGDTLSPYNHPDIAAGIVKPFVSEGNYFMVKHHGEFQGYYFWDYFGGLRLVRLFCGGLEATAEGVYPCFIPRQLVFDFVFKTI